MLPLRAPLVVLAVLAAALACGPAPTAAGGPDAGGDAGGTDAGATDAGEPPPARLRVATYNVHLFFDPTCDSGRCGPDDFEQAPTQADFEARADRIASAIRVLHPTVVCLQEIETQTSLDALQARLTDVLPESVLGETGTPGSVDVAVMSAAEILGVRRHREQVLYRPDGTATTFARELLEVHVRVGGHRAVVFCAHFRSQSNDDPGRRLAEAQAAAAIALDTAAELPDALVLLAGDLNDEPGSPPLDAIEASGDFERVAAELGADDWTFLWYQTRLALDHLYLDGASAGATVPGTVSVVRDGTRGLGGSDHAAVVADFLVGR